MRTTKLMRRLWPWWWRAFLAGIPLGFALGVLIATDDDPQPDWQRLDDTGRRVPRP